MYRWLNGLFIRLTVSSTLARPHPFSLWSPGPATSSPADYTSWTGLTDRSFTGRHLPPADPAWTAALPARDQLRALFVREQFAACPRSSTLFCFFAQWFTDSFLRTHPTEPLRNTSNHEIDLCQIYGICASDTRLLRSGVGGKLKSQRIGGEEYPEFLFERNGIFVRQQFLGLSYIDAKKRDFATAAVPAGFDTPHRYRSFFATGLERGNSSAFYTAISTIFLREHNRLCDEIARTNPTWGDDRIFETARNTNIAQLLKIIIQDYINHISSSAFKLFVDVGTAERETWYRTNRIAAEFDLLYRWHALVPNECVVDAQTVANQDFRFNNQFLIDKGLASLLGSASQQQAGNIRLQNTAFFLVDAEMAAVDKSRAWQLRSYNEYRQCFSLPPAKSFEDLTGDKAMAQRLEALYGDIDQVELMVGLLAEKRANDVVFGALMTRMVGSDAFSQALTNPLLAQAVFGEKTFSKAGLSCLEATSTLDQVVQRNTAMKGATASFEVPAVPRLRAWPWLDRVFDPLEFFFCDWYRFFTRRRSATGSSVFRVHLLQPITVVLDHQGIEPLFAAKKYRQDYGFGWAVPPLPLVGGVVPSLFESGEAHDRPKQLYMAMLAARRGKLLPVFEATARRFGQKWAMARRFGFQLELENFSAEFLFKWYFGLDADAADVRRLYFGMFSPRMLLWRLQRFIPGSPFNTTLAIYARLLAQVKASQGLGELLTQAHEIGLEDDDATAKQLLFVAGMNSFLGMQNLSKSVIAELSQRTELCAQLREEIQSTLGPAFPTSLRELSDAKLPLLSQFLRETVRLHPPVSLIFGRATQDQQINVSDGRSYPVRKGELVMGVLPLAMRDAALFPEPALFKPSRFDDPADRRGLIWPRGRQDEAATATDRTCPGKDVSVELMKLLCIWLLPNYRWRLAEGPVWEQKGFGLNVAAPKGAMQVEDFAAA
ncbi:hypothetical protein RD110_14310 [Rhodoferax koreense]|uniref:Uncharacterized protein n=1 Tax=Rhodoferax koreensis TaxID=1842727 RepID=A0A1P8JWU9_9BURK|nr:hypothetical protein RD110_14310 [Rhodoferax koreense]